MNNIKYISTRGKSKILGFKDVIFEGLASDGGLYIPDEWPIIDQKTLANFKNLSYQEIAYEVIKQYTDNSLSRENLQGIIKRSYSCFDNEEITPILKVNHDTYFLELYHGPTYAFKDVAMQFISQLMDFYLSAENKEINILGATSGDTGAAAIEGFKTVKSSRVFILHPYNKISEVQRKFMTTVQSNNIFNIAIKGSFDDCQNIIKDIFRDDKFKKSYNLTAINSINWARIMCQMVYYFYCISRIDTSNKKILFSVPTGNFGDILAGYIAKMMGLNINMLNIATNDNDILTRTLNSGLHELRSVKETISPSIDIQISSNFERLLFDLIKDPAIVSDLMDELNRSGSYTLSKNVLDLLRDNFCSFSVPEKEVNATIKEIYLKYNIIIDPHTAVGFASSEKCANEYDLKVILSTAHPSKFKNTVSKILNTESFITDKVKNIMNMKEDMIILDNDVNMVKNLLMDKIK
tara:strand:- start:113 stop:1507 length:1395 start_codon:yes stop_codon:yes gene_type:complete